LWGRGRDTGSLCCWPADVALDVARGGSSVLALLASRRDHEEEEWNEDAEVGWSQCAVLDLRAGALVLQCFVRSTGRM
jgi:hypothetical protein